MSAWGQSLPIDDVGGTSAIPLIATELVSGCCDAKGQQETNGSAARTHAYEMPLANLSLYVVTLGAMPTMCHSTPGLAKTPA